MKRARQTSDDRDDKINTTIEESETFPLWQPRIFVLFRWARICAKTLAIKRPGRHDLNRLANVRRAN